MNQDLERLMHDAKLYRSSKVTLVRKASRDDQGRKTFHKHDGLLCEDIIHPTVADFIVREPDAIDSFPDSSPVHEEYVAYRGDLYQNFAPGAVDSLSSTEFTPLKSHLTFKAVQVTPDLQQRLSQSLSNVAPHARLGDYITDDAAVIGADVMMSHFEVATAIEFIGYHGSANKLHAFDLDCSSKGNFGAGIYVADKACAIEHSPIEEVGLSTFKVQLANPLIIRADYNLGEQLGIETPAVPLLVALYGPNAPVAGLIDDDGHLNELVTEAAKRNGHDGIVAYYENEAFEAVIFDNSSLSDAHPLDAMNGYQMMDFTAGLREASEASIRLANESLDSLLRVNAQGAPAAVIQLIHDSHTFDAKMVINTINVERYQAMLAGEKHMSRESLNWEVNKILALDITNEFHVIGPDLLTTKIDGEEHITRTSECLAVVAERTRELSEVISQPDSDQDSDYRPQMNMIM